MITRIFIYIQHRDRSAFEALGWIVTPMIYPHGVYSLIGEWVGDGEPVRGIDVAPRGGKASAGTVSRSAARVMETRFIKNPKTYADWH